MSETAQTAPKAPQDSPKKPSKAPGSKPNYDKLTRRQWGFIERLARGQSLVQAVQDSKKPISDRRIVWKLARLLRNPRIRRAATLALYLADRPDTLGDVIQASALQTIADGLSKPDVALRASRAFRSEPPQQGGENRPTDQGTEGPGSGPASPAELEAPSDGDSDDQAEGGQRESAFSKRQGRSSIVVRRRPGEGAMGG